MWSAVTIGHVNLQTLFETIDPNNYLISKEILFKKHIYVNSISTLLLSQFDYIKYNNGATYSLLLEQKYSI